MSQPSPRPCLREQLVEGAQAADAHQVEQLLARVGKVLAEVVVDGDAAARELGLQDLRHQRRAAAAGAGRLGALS